MAYVNRLPDILYNEINPYAVEYLRRLMLAGQIAPGDIDTRSIEDVRPDDLRRYRQCHFFAGMGVWSYALRGVGWSDDRPIWTGSCPCQPFSEAGQGNGFADERHLWPAFFHLVTHGRPVRVVGEQVAGKDGLTWLDLVSSDLEAADYAVRAVPLCSAGFGSPDIRNRLYWCGDDFHRMADALGVGQRSRLCDSRPAQQWRHIVADSREPGGLADPNDGERWADSTGRDHGAGQDAGRPQSPSDLEGRCEPLGMGYATDERSQRLAHGREPLYEPEWAAFERTSGHAGGDGGPGPINGFWRAADWVLCRDPGGPRWRPVRPGAFPLAHGLAQRLGRLSAAGNAINAQVAQEFLRALDQ